MVDDPDVKGPKNKKMKYYFGSDSTYNRPCEELYSHCHTIPEVVM